MEQNQFTPAAPPRYPAGNRELMFALGMLVLGSFLWNSIFWGGFNLGFGLGALALMGCSYFYLKKRGCRFDRYSAALLALAAVLALGFGRSDDSALKLCMALALLFGVNLSFCLAAGQNRRDPGSLGSALDAPRAFFMLGFGGLGKTSRGLREAGKSTGAAGKQGGAALLGLVLAFPVAAVMIFLLMRSDAAFEGLMDGLPKLNWVEAVVSLVFGFHTAWFLTSRALGLTCGERAEKTVSSRRLNPITWNVVLGAVCLIYCVYLVSQLAYLGGGFRGILPEDYTLAQYARRGFFEMAWLGAINLGLMCLSMALAEKGKNRLTRMFCLFLGAVTLFLTATASAKMLLYIDSYGLTRLRVLTQSVMLWLAVTTVLVTVWLFRPGFGYMKGTVLAALALGVVLLWGDVDAQVAKYNVRAYQRGDLETVDLVHLSNLSDGALPYIEALAKDPELAQTALDILENWSCRSRDFRGWNAASAQAAEILEQYPREMAEYLPADSSSVTADIEALTGLDTTNSHILEGMETHGGFHGDGTTFQSRQFSQTPEFGEGWKALPMSETAAALCYGIQTEEGRQGPYLPEGLIPEISHGYFFFFDRHTQSMDPYDTSLVLKRGSFNFTLLVYDLDTNVLYYIEHDT